MKIAAILTCHNRKEKTLRSLRCLFASLDVYNAKRNNLQGDTITLTVFLTDDGCTDGTADAVNQSFPKRQITIVNGDGNLFWAGGMRKAWREAIRKEGRVDFFLLLNDDTFAFPTMLAELLATHRYCTTELGKTGIYSGVTCDERDTSIITYSGDVFDNQRRLTRLGPSGKPQRVDVTNANALLVPQAVVDDIGIFYDGYTHSCADNDYAIQANRHGHPALITAHVCAYCEFDHKDAKNETMKLATMNYAERKSYLKHPLHSDPEYLEYIRRNFPKLYPITWTLRHIRLICPKLYIKINELRGIY